MIGRLLKRIRGAEYRLFIEGLRHDLQPYRKPVLRKAARYGYRRYAGQICRYSKYVGEVHA